MLESGEDTGVEDETLVPKMIYFGIYHSGQDPCHILQIAFDLNAVIASMISRAAGVVCGE